MDAACNGVKLWATSEELYKRMLVTSCPTLSIWLSKPDYISSNVLGTLGASISMGAPTDEDGYVS